MTPQLRGETDERDVCACVYVHLCAGVYVCVTEMGVESVRSIHTPPPLPTLIHYPLFAVYLYLAVALPTLPVRLQQSILDSNSTCLPPTPHPPFLSFFLSFPFLFLSFTQSLTPPWLFYPLLLFPCLISQWINLEAGYQSVTNGP